MVERAAKYGAVIVRPERMWYGLDPIHILPRQRPDAWRCIISTWRTGTSVASAPPTGAWQAWWLARPKYQRIFGVEQRCPQPTVRLADGTHVSLY
jgi:hypothetical protein